MYDPVVMVASVFLFHLTHSLVTDKNTWNMLATFLKPPAFDPDPPCRIPRTCNVYTATSISLIRVSVARTRRS